MIVAIYAYENSYGGLHGRENCCVTEVDNIKSAHEWGKISSIEVIESYNLLDEFVEMAEDEGLEPDSDEWDEYINACVDEEIAYQIWVVREDTGLTLEELNDEFYNDREGFIERYCEKEVE